MKLVIFSPAKKASSIGGCSGLISREFVARGHNVTIVRTEAESMLKNETHDFGGLLLPWTDSDRVLGVARDADALIYQVGDNYDFHKGGLKWLEMLPGIVILHDFFLGHLFRTWADSNRTRALEVLRIWYGEEAANTYFVPHESEIFIERTRDNCPMIEWVCSMATGVITHSSWNREPVLRSCGGPVRVVALTHNKDLVPHVSTTKNTLSDSGKFIILTIGHMNRNKRVESVISAIGRSPLLRDNSIYHLVGAIQPATSVELVRLAKNNGVQLVISGEVDDETLLRAIDESDIISCLRWPSLEAASGSLVEALLNGKPTIVMDTGFYKEIPDSCVLKINPDNEIADIQSALELLFEDRDQRRTIALEGQRWASQTFTAENYVAALLDMVIESMKTRPVLDAINYFSRTIFQWSAHYDFAEHQPSLHSLDIFTCP